MVFQQLHKQLLELIHRLPTNDLLKPYVKSILSLMFKLLEVSNLDNMSIKILHILIKQAMELE